MQDFFLCYQSNWEYSDNWYWDMSELFLQIERDAFSILDQERYDQCGAGFEHRIKQIHENPYRISQPH